MDHVVSAGGIITKIENNQTKICLINLMPLSPKYCFPKGHVEASETLETAALREVREETGLQNLSIAKYLGFISRKATERTGKVVDKDIHLFLMKTDDFNHQIAEENYEWHTLPESIDILLPEEKQFLLNHQAEIVI